MQFPGHRCAAPCQRHAIFPPEVCLDFCTNVSDSQFLGFTYGFNYGFECFCTPWFEQSTGG